MTRISIDPEAALRTLRSLDVVATGIDAEQRRLHHAGLLVLPPRVAGSVAAEVDALKALLAGDAEHARAVSRTLAQTQLRILIASGSASPGVALKLLDYAFDGSGPTHAGRSRSAADALADAARTGHDAVGVFKDLLGAEEVLMFLALTKNGMTPKQFEKVWGDYLTSGGRGRVSAKTGGKVLAAIGFVDGVLTGHEKSSAHTEIGKWTSGLLGSGTITYLDTAAGVPVAGTIDFATGGLVTGAIDADVVVVETIITGDAAGIDQYSADSLSGKHGWGIQKIAQAGNSLGGGLYDAGQAFSDAGNALGGKLYDGGQAARNLTKGISPFW